MRHETVAKLDHWLGESESFGRSAAIVDFEVLAKIRKCLFSQRKRLVAMRQKFDAVDTGAFDPLKESMPEFERRYIAEHPEAVFGVNRIALPCTCADGAGPTHYAVIANNPEAIKEHFELETMRKENAVNV